MAQGIALTYGGQVRYVKDIRVAKDGVIRTPARALVSCGDRALEVWPPTLDPNQSGIQMTTAAVLARDIRRVDGPQPVEPEPEDPTPPTPPGVEPTPPPPDPTIPPQQEPSDTWFEFFGAYISQSTSFRQETPIPTQGVAITFKVTSDWRPQAILCQTIQVAGQSSTPNRTVSLSTTPLDFVGLAFQNQAVNQRLVIRINGSTQTASGDARYVDIGPGRYYLNIKNVSTITPYNWVKVECFRVIE